jgi:hypothetical protein
MDILISIVKEKYIAFEIMKLKNEMEIYEINKNKYNNVINELKLLTWKLNIKVEGLSLRWVKCLMIKDKVIIVKEC